MTTKVDCTSHLRERSRGAVPVRGAELLFPPLPHPPPRFRGPRLPKSFRELIIEKGFAHHTRNNTLVRSLAIQFGGTEKHFVVNQRHLGRQRYVLLRNTGHRRSLKALQHDG
ncbi:hypothetical protein, unlikely [Trypanosoma brucei gambiense DAL972]|uniref:Uncharacterized protein n=1 Tax=Trypanosoma brucei gambiense (strain MHOM/CI/86/DAL972) TaxID=679716 RepID=D0A4G1_TRYB9|nr:hypothetical protein, unlikely [Trypanosoma brucei gambiense DAL972]CBH16155.1 hypothetical protein, unlikely [Trypanosoma brucei gambiense DAL972]|eukprot:XP_011778419.1 hypothetical protein, unlikely [Trypanosoma brucei gambiense DAL972]